jgi:hypothetical protein
MLSYIVQAARKYFSSIVRESKPKERAFPDQEEYARMVAEQRVEVVPLLEKMLTNGARFGTMEEHSGRVDFYLGATSQFWTMEAKKQAVTDCLMEQGWKVLHFFEEKSPAWGFYGDHIGHFYISRA